MLERFELFGDRSAISDGPTGRSYTYKEVSQLTKKAGSALKRLGVGSDDVIALHLPNIPEYVPIFYGIQAAGNIISTINSALLADEIAYQLQDCGAKYVISTSPIMAAAKEAATKANISSQNVLDFEYLWDLIVKDDGSHLPEVYMTDNPDEHVFCLPYSSGTTGRPKGVMLTDTNFIAHAMVFGNERFMSKREDIEQESVLGLLPFFHAYGLAYIIGTCLHLGSKVVCMQKFEPEMFLKIIEREKLTELPIVPPLALFLAKDPMVDNYDLTAVEKILSAAAPLAKEVEELLWKKLPTARVIRQGWGMTETTAGCIINPSEKSLVKSGSVGVLLPLIEGKVIDLETGESVGPNIDGEICVKGPTVAKGYLNNPEATAETINKDGWLHTGDIGHYDEDKYFYIVDRKKELIKYKGFQVAPADLEAVLVSNPSIADAAVIGIPDDKGGEVPKAFVVPRGEITEEQIKDYVASKVSPHKRLRGGVTFVDMIPKTASGKILRRMIRNQISDKKLA
ncbi:4-coumarate--CoA ligase 1 [Exaiptasia diaphana]|uniref:4-coumarate--CoA ligase n=1 Tax=Exaiptasia diaphana TaxID=2652724 RepID=A0A913YB60_EXADI|nr:4-coumarate--CoA ligase 1 [Exaiptasia diaphana]KXJ19134.1 4-coumarate--CoA ligase [Exaiptasia diaphana]